MKAKFGRPSAADFLQTRLEERRREFRKHPRETLARMSRAENARERSEVHQRARRGRDSIFHIVGLQADLASLAPQDGRSATGRTKMEERNVTQPSHLSRHPRILRERLRNPSPQRRQRETEGSRPSSWWRTRCQVRGGAAVTSELGRTKLDGSGFATEAEAGTEVNDEI
ncbi:hypothetical protein PC110_g19649 [Phytophthora cactorum]|uniref:Uncharacterized protein n=1 Tax=Phytophthora cactorum TaxID=29920 RepID=A0A329RID7_9STRA|nr:hypothetical protein PC114_g18669 [Phytophthora cactorum]KAG2914949.1 hypothetical protein PC117_g18176 [Phytophthora cactorum]RAW23919.1 hypothetical protein PC110_g19649 [Phytophthora cactorum]